jgi:hypothetical protein
VRGRELVTEDTIAEKNERGDHGGWVIRKTFLEPSFSSAGDSLSLTSGVWGLEYAGYSGNWRPT